MEKQEYVQPLSASTRQNFFMLLVGVFIVALPFLYLYATGYRFDLKEPTNLIGTGGIYVAVDRTGAEIYIDDELVRETRAFRRAFYAQSLDVGTHRLHVQKEGHHTWVKELPVTKHLVTEANAFNLPIVPDVRVISKWQTATGSALVGKEFEGLRVVNPIVSSTTIGTSTRVENLEYQALMLHFGTTSTSTKMRDTSRVQIKDLFQTATSTDALTGATSTVISSGVILQRSGDDVYASWVGTFDDMPYYFCAPDFPRYTGTTTLPIPLPVMEELLEDEEEEDGRMHPVQRVSKDTVCEPMIRLDRKEKEVRSFHFFPGSTDFVILVFDDGAYVVEIDDRAWQNVQPLFLGQNLTLHIENGNVFVYDGEIIYQVVVTTE